MEDQENVAEEIAAEEIVQPQEETSTEVSEPESPISEETQTQSDKDYNFAQLRKSKQQLQSRVEELEDHLAKLSQPKEAQEEEDFGIDDEDLAEGKHLKKVYKELRQLQKQLQDEKIASIPDRLKSRFNDFDDVVTKENVEKLKMAEPELYATLTAGSDLMAKGVSVYKTLKSLGMAENFDETKKVVAGNHKKPVSTSAIKGQGALSDSNIFARGLTPELKKQLQQEMSQAVKAR